jgi:hypothetical protein
MRDCDGHDLQIGDLVNVPCRSEGSMSEQWVYLQSEPGLYTVGHFSQGGRWFAETDYGSKEEAARRCHYLNGGCDPELLAAAQALHKLDWCIGYEMVQHEELQTALDLARAALAKVTIKT